ncbi:Hypothetical Protein FCC1311_060822 [Hondaea fermentalgiana]|uniref:DUF1279 domain-containing protein n=1 Tax=Hondaea fermentalgiana TaxID=2315210 RepID=A0A2R5GG24_9STRA|nr:Hypothetical Protein FCC1311_060822 [Hondaea fermentalgiana]|eukprot:GBG29862.1 Hypothetical Protein FCC1311_060822 [Hondaea fermentalgiana]
MRLTSGLRCVDAAGLGMIEIVVRGAKKRWLEPSFGPRLVVRNTLRLSFFKCGDVHGAVNGACVPDKRGPWHDLRGFCPASGEAVRGLEGRRSNTAWPEARRAYSSKYAEAPALGLLATQHRAAASITGARAFSTGAGPSGGAGKKSSEDEKNAKKDAQNGTTTIAGVVQDAQNMASNVKDGAQNMASNVKDGAQNMASNVKDGAQAAMNTASDMRDGAQAAIDQVPVSRIKALIRDFGPVAIGVYGGIYVGTLGLLYGLVEADIVGAGDAISVLKSTGLNHFVDMDKINPRMGNFAVAWILTKFTEPPRLLLALAVTPRVARAIGWAPRKRDKDGNAVH